MGFVYELLINIIYILCVIFIGYFFFNFVRRKNKFQKILVIILGLITTVIFIYAETWVKAIVHMSCVLVILLTYFKEKLKTMLGFYFGSTVVLSLLSMLLEVMSNGIVSFIQIEMIQEQMRLMAYIFLSLGIGIVGKYFKENHPGVLRKIGNKYWVFFVIMLFFDAFIVLLLGNFVLNTIKVSNRNLLLFSFACVVIGILIQLILLINTLVTRNVHKENEALAKQFLDNQKEHYMYLEKREHETKKFRHDIKNHLLLLENFMTNNENEKAKEYLATLNEKVNAFSNHVSVNNGIADAVLNKFFEEAQEKSVELKVSGHFPQACYISAYDICTVLSNLLSNAVLAASESNERSVWVDIRHTSDELLLVVENEFNHKLMVDNRTYLSTKKDSFGHGFGLSNVKECVERNEGHMTISTENHRFKVMLSMKTRKRKMHENCNCR